MKKRTLKVLFSIIMCVVGSIEICFGVQNITRGFEEIENMLKKKENK